MLNRFPRTILLACAFAVGTATAQTGNVTVLHGIPGLPAPVDVFANGNQLFSFEYGEQRGPLALTPGTYNLDVQLNGTSVLTASATVAAGQDYSVIAHLDASGNNQLSVFQNDISALSLPATRLTVRHTAQAPAVDVVLEQGGSTVATLANLSNPNETGADVPPGVYSASLFVAGTQNRASGPVDLAIDNGYSYIVYAVGDVSGPSFQLLVQRFSLTAAVSVVHGIPGLPAPVDVLANGAQLFSFEYTDIRGPLILNPGRYTLDVSLQGNVVLTLNATLAAGDDVSVVAHLDANGGNNLSAFVNDQSELTALGSRLTARHLANAPAVDIALDTQGNRAATIPNVSNGGEAVAVVPPTFYEASLFAAGTQTRAFGPVALKTSTDVHYLIYAVGDLNAGNFTLLRQFRALGSGVVGQLEASAGGQSCGPTISTPSATFPFGEPFELAIDGAEADVMAVLHVGLSNTQFGALALPFSMAPFGAPGCFVNTDVLSAHPLTLDANGSAAIELVVPLSSFSRLPTLYFQYVAMSTANALGLQSTEYLAIGER